MAHLAHYREAHPLVFVITHWINLIAMIVLIVTGFCIHFPFWPYFESLARGMHVFFGFVIFLNCVFRIIAAFFVKTAPTGGTRKQVTDFKTWLPQADNRHQGLQWIKYYLFLKKDHPLSAKLGVPQKISYLCIPVLIIVMFYTGMCLWVPTMNLPFFAAGTNLVGGLMSMRIIHYFMMYIFIWFTMIHGYLALIDGMALPRLMFFGKETGGLTYSLETWNIDGYDDLGAAEKIEIVNKEDEQAAATA